jgi:hypothetical protein
MSHVLISSARTSPVDVNILHLTLHVHFTAVLHTKLGVKSHAFCQVSYANVQHRNSTWKVPQLGLRDTVAKHLSVSCVFGGSSLKNSQSVDGAFARSSALFSQHRLCRGMGNECCGESPPSDPNLADNPSMTADLSLLTVVVGLANRILFLCRQLSHSNQFYPNSYRMLVCCTGCFISLQLVWFQR